MIGFIGQIQAAYSRYSNPPHVIPASLFMRNESFGLATKDGDESFFYTNIPFDLLIDESHELKFDITDHAVENGASLADHIQQRLRTVKITGMFTNHPVGGSRAFVNENDELNNRNWRDGRVEIDNAPAITNTALSKWELLTKCAKSRKKLRVITSLEVYEEMYIERLSADRGPDDGESIKFELTLREIRTAKFDSKSVTGEWDAPQPAQQATDEQQAMSKKANAGNVSGDGSETAEEAVRKMDESLGREYG